MKKQIVSLFHFGYWSFYLAILLIVFFALQVGDVLPRPYSYFLRLASIFVLLPSILGFYLSYFIFFKKYLQNRNLLSILIYGASGVILIAMICGLCISLIFGTDFMFENGFESFYSELLIIAIIALINGIIGFVLRGFFSWYADLKITEELQQHTHAMELELIKSKLDPHFLFNTINNIDGMMIKDVSVASKYLDKLSTILRFMLYESKGEKIALSKELEYIQKYIDLQKIRTTTPDFVNFTIEGLHFEHQIPSMLFIPFIENAFKHVATKKQFHAIEIEILIYIEKIVFHCKNIYDPNAITSTEEGHIGNKLIEKRLQLLYPNQHELITTMIDKIYSVQLTIMTHEN